MSSGFSVILCNSYKVVITESSLENHKHCLSKSHQATEVPQYRLFICRLHRAAKLNPCSHNRVCLFAQNEPQPDGPTQCLVCGDRRLCLLDYHVLLQPSFHPEVPVRRDHRPGQEVSTVVNIDCYYYKPNLNQTSKPLK